MSKLSNDEFEEINNAFIAAQNSDGEEKEQEKEHIDFLADLKGFVDEKDDNSSKSREIQEVSVDKEIEENQSTQDPVIGENRETGNPLDDLVLGNNKIKNIQTDDDMIEVENPLSKVQKAYIYDEAELEAQRRNAMKHSGGSEYRERWESDEDRKKNKRKKNGKKSRFSKGQKVVIGILLAILILILAVAGTIYGMHQAGKKSVMADDYGKTFDNTITYKGEKYAYNKDMTAIAFMGVDKETFGLEDNRVGTAGQSDVNMVVALNTKTGKTSVIVIPRDVVTDIDKYSIDGEFMGTDKNQLCLAYAYGNGKDTSCKNAVLSIQRVLYGVPINTYFALNLDGVPALNDAIGGVTLTCQSDLGDRFFKGTEVTLIGEDAKYFIRARDEGLSGDKQRRARQIQYVKAFISQAAQQCLSDSKTFNKLYDVGKEYSVTNLTFSKGVYLGSLALSNSSEMLSFNNIISLKGTLKYTSDGYAQTVLDEDYTIKSVLNTFYTKVK